MKKIILTGLASLLGVFVLAIPAYAATTASLSPSQVNIVAGKSFTVTVSVDPHGDKNYAETLEIDFPMDLLSVSSFTFANNWTPLTQAGYDSTDNTKGILVKTAGYPGGLSSSAALGTITFLAKKTGSGTITIGNKSMAFQASSKSAVTGNGSAFTITPSTVVPASQKAAPKKPAPVMTDQITEATDIEQSGQSIAKDDNTQVAAVALASSITSSSTIPTPTKGGNSWTWALVVIVGLVVLFGIYRWFKGQRRM